jgi:hypothetical protein
MIYCHRYTDGSIASARASRQINCALYKSVRLISQKTASDLSLNHLWSAINCHIDD